MKNLTSYFLLMANCFKSKVFGLFLCTMLFVGRVYTQVCQLPDGVVCTLNDPSVFKVITTSKTFSQMIADGDLLP